MKIYECIELTTKRKRKDEGGFMTHAPATFAPEVQIKPQSKPKLTLCLALTYTYIVILILTLTQTRAYTLNYSESKCR
jgi:hypothetical protein